VATNSTDLLVTRLRELRRRATLVLFAQALCVSGAASMLIGEALVVGGAAQNVVAAVVVAATAALLTAAAATIVLRPSLRDIAASIDARLHLQDRLVTALQFNAAVDPFSQLVVRDAHSRVAAVRASDAVPFALPLSIRAVSAAAAIVSAVMIVATAEVPPWSRAGWTSLGGPDVPANAAVGAGPASSAAKQQLNQAESSSASANRTERSSARQQSGSDRTEATTPSVQARDLSEMVSPSSGGTGRLERGATARGDTTGTDTGTNTPDDAGVASGGASTSYEPRGGGVANGTRSALSTDTTAPFDDPAYRAAYLRGRVAAESAVAQDRVPTDLRSYVRDYFVAIRPAGDK